MEILAGVRSPAFPRSGCRLGATSTSSAHNHRDQSTYSKIVSIEALRVSVLASRLDSGQVELESAMLKSGRVVKGGRGGQASGGRTLEDAFKASRGRRTQKGREEDVLSVEVEDEDRESVGEGPLSPPVHLHKVRG